MTEIFSNFLVTSNSTESMLSESYLAYASWPICLVFGIPVNAYCLYHLIKVTKLNSYIKAIMAIMAIHFMAGYFLQSDPNTFLWNSKLHHLYNSNNPLGICWTFSSNYVCFDVYDKILHGVDDTKKQNLSKQSHHNYCFINSHFLLFFANH